MDDEIAAIERNKTWELTELPNGHKTIDMKWVYKTKLKETVARHDTIKLVIALTTQNSWPIFKLDVKSSFLHGDLSEQTAIRLVGTPTETSLKLVKDDNGRVVNNTLYKQIVGSLMYLTTTRPDITYVVNAICKFMERPKEMHLQPTKRILRYLQGTIDYGILYKKGEKSNLIGFTDSDYAGDQDDRKSTSGYVFMLGSGAVSWSSRKQLIVTLSTTEAELVAASACVCQAIWMRKFLEEAHFKQKGPTIIYCENSSTIKLSKNPILHGQSKYIDVQYHFLRDRVNYKEIDMVYCRSEDQIADIFTKALKLATFQKLRQML
ncbi:Ubiquitin carboxyl-terminal hydrolase family protein [Hibiscus syriacus]|uniref:Ubiquitin carboxyl-terminal hydrolase family protein n=1 Tax=Hibiscus syriacus TaxID=106335 RepID=A0A6A2YQ07_HIBSY|nr:Ubiquitin carboxyl-terminal hydrolase family protein [Hibiscus syriacus]